MVEVDHGATAPVIADAVIDAVIRARKDYKGSGNPTFFTTADFLTDMLLLKDGMGRRLYNTVAELATALRVRDIVEVPVMEGLARVVNEGEANEKSYPLVGIIVNLQDYNIGADKGGAINLFDDFDIDYNQMKYLIETRISGALIKPFSAIAIEIDEAAE
jgi:HK97 family phage major capsid protein